MRLTRSISLATLLAVTGVLSGSGGTCSFYTVQIDRLVDGGQAAICPCFTTGEVAMVILDTPPGTATLDAVQILWDVFFGSAPDTLEQAIIVYDLNQTGPVVPSSFIPVEVIKGPVLVQGFLNQFDVSKLAVELPENRFGIGLEFATDQVNKNPNETPSIVNDANGFNTSGGIIRNWVFAEGLGWQSSQALGLSGDWVIRAIVEGCTGPCPWDLTGDQLVGTADLLSLLALWGTDPGGPPDFDGDGNVATSDLLDLLANWGRCG